LDNVRDGEIKGEEDTEPYKPQMLKCLFSPNNNPYKQLIDVFLGKTKLKLNQNIDDYWIRYFIPLIMLFSGARPSELAKIKTDDCELREFEDGKERVILYIHKKVKTKTSKRIIVIHDFLAEDLGFIKFIKKAKKENREYLFNRGISASGLAGKEFNRKKIKDECIKPHLDKEDEFWASRYVMYSLRHNYKTHMMFHKYDADLVRKIQGHKDEKVSNTYLSTNAEQIVNFVNDFSLYEIIDWTEFKKVAKAI
jgi:integrase